MNLKSLLPAALGALLAVVSPLAAQEKGGSLKIALFPEPPTAVAGLSGLGSAAIVSSKIYEALVKFAPDLTPQPWLARSWTQSPDGLTWTFDLVENAQWHDGTPFTADDILASYKIFSAENDRLRVLATKIASIDATGKYQVKVKLKENVPSFIYNFSHGSMPILPAHLYGSGKFRDNPANANPVGTGAFVIKEWKKGGYIRLTRFNKYRESGKPYLDDLYFVIIPDAQGCAVAFEGGSVDVVSASNLEAFDVARLAKLTGVEATNKGWEMLAPHAFLWVNTQKAPLTDAKLRQAMNLALDKSFIREAIFGGLAKAPRGAIDSRTRFFDTATAAYSFDPGQAKALVAASSYKGEELKLSTAPVGSSWARLAEYQIQAWKEIGLNVRIDNTDVGGYLKKLADRNYDLGNTYLYQYGDPAVGVTRLFYGANDVPGSPWNNVGRYHNPALDALMGAADREPDPSKRGELYAKVQKVIADEAVQIWTAELEFPTLYRTKVRNLITTAFGLSDGFENVWVSK